MITHEKQLNKERRNEMFDINIELLRKQVKEMTNRGGYHHVTLNGPLENDLRCSVVEEMVKDLSDDPFWEIVIPEPPKIKRSRKKAKEKEITTKRIAKLIIFNNGLVSYGVYDEKGEKHLCTMERMREIFNISFTRCFVPDYPESFDGILTQALISLNTRIR